MGDDRTVTQREDSGVVSQSQTTHAAAGAGRPG